MQNDDRMISLNDLLSDDSIDEVQADKRFAKMWGNFRPPSDETVKQYKTITPEQYVEFEVFYTWAALKGMRYGEAFCEHFGISNASPLYYFKTFELADRWIRDNYLTE